MSGEAGGGYYYPDSEDEAATLRPWWVCPNEPRCPHAAVIHDVYDSEDKAPRCCAEGCQCGARPDRGPA